VLGDEIDRPRLLILSEQKARPIYFVAEHTIKAADGQAARTAAE